MVVEQIQNATLDQRVVLLAMVESTRDRSTPVNPADLRRVCNERLAAPDGPVAGGLTEADVTRALYRLEDAGLVENVAEGNTSPAGKGRPAYRLVADADDVTDTLATSEDLAPVVETLD